MMRSGRGCRAQPEPRPSMVPKIHTGARFISAGSRAGPSWSLPGFSCRETRISVRSHFYRVAKAFPAPRAAREGVEAPDESWHGPGARAQCHPHTRGRNPRGLSQEPPALLIPGIINVFLPRGCGAVGEVKPGKKTRAHQKFWGAEGGDGTEA